MKLYSILITVLFYFHLPAIANEIKDSSHETINLTVSTVNSTCQRANGKVIVDATGGTAPYSYKLTATAFLMQNTTGIFYKVPAGSYTLTVTDALGQVEVQLVTVTNAFLRPGVVLAGRTLPSGCMAADASFSINGTGGLRVGSCPHEPKCLNAKTTASMYWICAMSFK